MKISGINKLTLLDYPGLLACILFTNGCNLKCPYCQNSEFIDGCAPNVEKEEIYDFLEKRKNILDGVVISGGEPTIHKDLKEFINKVKSYGYKIKLDTNGTNYKMLSEIIDEKLVDYVAMDIKSSFINYNKVSGKKIDTDNILKSIRLLKNSDIDHEFRTTIVKEFHDIEDLKSICKTIGKNSKYFIQNFECSENVIEKNLTSFNEGELINIRTKLMKEYPNIKIRGIKKELYKEEE